MTTVSPKSARSKAEDAASARFVLADNQQARGLFGPADTHLKALEERYPVRIVARGNEISIHGEPAAVEQVERLLQELIAVVQRGQHLTLQDVQAAASLAAHEQDALGAVLSDTVLTTARGRPIRPKTAGQKRYIETLRRHGIVFAIGPAGTGKTYLAMAKAVAALKKQQVHRIILTRPAVEAGEKLGFLPGDLQEKVNPYLRPLYDALYDMLGVETVQRYLSSNIIEVAPLAYMRGRTLDDSFIILDEAQNTTSEQMKMFLTRMGAGSRVVVTGDVTQVDLPRSSYSGLQEVQTILKDVEGIGFVYLAETDVVRHPLVQRIIRAYDSFEAAAVQPENVLTATEDVAP